MNSKIVIFAFAALLAIAGISQDYPSEDLDNKGSAPKGSAPKGSAPKGSAPKGSAPKGSEPKAFSIPEPRGLVNQMDNEKLGILLNEFGEKVEGRPGFWRFVFDGVEMLCVTDENANRMRIMTPIVPLEEVSGEQMAACMIANFDRALDARYCVNGENLWGAFVHPLSDLTELLFRAAIYQVAKVKQNFGTSYSSGGLQFGGGASKPAETAPSEDIPDA